MKFLFVTYRWGDDLVGGAELHHRRLAEELIGLGHEVTALTTTAHELRTFCHWGTEWKAGHQPGLTPGRIPVQRVPFTARPRWRQALDAKILQWAWEREEESIPEGFLLKLLRDWPVTQGVALLSGWHHPELSDGRAVRWSHRCGRLAVRLPAGVGGRISIKGNAPKLNHATLRHQGNVLARKDTLPGWFDLEAVLPPGFEGVLSFEYDSVWRPLRDFRGLGLYLNGIEVYLDSGEVLRADLAADYRSLGRANPREWQAHLFNRAMNRAPSHCARIDRLRGPQSPEFAAAIDAVGADHTIHCNLPWGNVSLIRPGDLAMPLWHIEDEFFYWRHWIEALRRTRFVLANTPHTAREFFPPIGIRAHFVGPPIWEPGRAFSADSLRAFRTEHGIADGEILVLTVCRKSPEKRYDAIADSVARLREEGLPIRMLGVGPDIDGRAFDYDGCRWVGKLGGDDLQRAYAACDAFVLMSESESFGMVIPEAWHHARPVVVNRLCPTSASLLDDGVDGLLAQPGEELDAALRDLASSPERRTAMGLAGREKAQANYVRGAAGKRLLAALEAKE